jgi:hypothetical protein
MDTIPKQLTIDKNKENGYARKFCAYPFFDICHIEASDSVSTAFCF